MQLLHACTLAVTHHQAIGQGSARDPPGIAPQHGCRPPASALSSDLIRWDQAGARKRCPPQPTRVRHGSSPRPVYFHPLDGNGLAGPGSDRRQNSLIHRGHHLDMSEGGGGGAGPGEGFERGQSYLIKIV